MTEESEGKMDFEDHTMQHNDLVHDVMEDSEDMSIVNFHEEKTEKYFDDEYKKMEKEDAIMFGCDSWLRHCVEKESEEQSNHQLVSESPNARNQSITSQVSKNNDKNNYVPECIDLTGSTVCTIEEPDYDIIYVKSTPKTSAQSETANQIGRQITEENSNQNLSTKETASPVNSTIQNVHESKSKKITVCEAAETGLCSFQCPDCFVVYKNWNRLKEHVEEKHDKPIKMSNCKTYLSEVLCHVCKICHDKVLCETSYMTCHFRDRHGMSLNDYRVKYNCNISSEARLQEALDNGRQSSEDIGDLCTFECPKCDKLYGSIEKLESHNYNNIIKCLQHTRSNFWLECLEVVVAHKCKLCSKLVLCDTRTLHKHMISNHKIKSLQEYSKGTGINIISKSMAEKKLENNLLKCNNDKTKLVGNFCQYKCHVCKHGTKFWPNMKEHLQVTNHGKYGRNDVDQYLSVACLHKCKICDKKMPNDRYLVDTHLKSYHKVTPSQYVRKFNLTLISY